MYQGLIFPKITGRPFFYTNFVATVDGKTQVLQNTNAYWPIGSKIDYDTLVELRMYADALVHGKNTVHGFRTLNTLEDPEFQKRRKKLGKNKLLPYVVISGHPDESLTPNLKNSNAGKPILITCEKATVPEALTTILEIERVGKESIDIIKTAKLLYKKGFKHVLVEGGPRLLGSFLKERLIDEIFLTIAPKIFGNQKGKTITMVEGFLFEAKNIPKLKLISIKQVVNELYLRYCVSY